MENFRFFFQFLHKFIYLSDEEFNQQIKPFLQVRQFRKKQAITVAGEIENYVNFINSGLVRKYFVNATDEINTQISTEGQIVTSFESFHTRQPSDYYIETIEASTLVSVSHDNLEKIFSSGSKMERLGRLMTSFLMIMKDHWQIGLIKLTPRERFLSFVKKNPELLQRVPQKYLASFLNIQPETFSRFKHLLKERI